MKRGTICFLLVIGASLVLSTIFRVITDANDIARTGVWAMVIFATIQYTTFFLIFFFVARMDAATRTPQQMIREYRLDKRITAHEIFSSILLGAICIATFLFVQTSFINILELVGWSSGGDPLVIDTWAQYIAMMFAFALLPSIVEELVFRGLILTELKKYGKWPAIIASAALFSIFHVNPAQTVHQFALGLIFAIIVVYSGKLILAMLVHFVNNAIVITYTFAMENSEFPIAWTGFDTATGWILAILGIAVIWAMLALFKRPDAKWQWGNKKFVESDNMGYLICMVVAGALWISTFFI